MHRPVLQTLLWLLVLLCLAWGGTALALTPVSAGLRVALLSSGVLAAAAAIGVLRRRRHLAAALCGATGIAIALVLRMLPTASNERPWQPPQARLASVSYSPGQATVHNVRNFRYAASGAVVDARWEDRHYDPAQIETAWLGISPFSGVPGVGHAFVSFGFSDGRYLAISVEARREQGEAYGPLSGLFRSYEIVYVVADERDLIGLRTQVWNDDVHLYPVRADREAIRAVFLDMLDRATRLAQVPEFYDTVVNSCSVNLARHVNRVAPDTVPMISLRLMLAGFSGELAHDLGLVRFDGPFEEARARFRVNGLAQGDVDAGDFSGRIRSAPQ